ncbi:MAG: hypothetical protein DHS20C17_25660 [Cyclobacteriaceae bacterium]|nr:MAG: hypothetical protein DHS20C17_25660 [Cyclobacteriaceae bacterium]
MKLLNVWFERKTHQFISPGSDKEFRFKGQFCFYAMNTLNSITAAKWLASFQNYGAKTYRTYIGSAIIQPPGNAYIYC